MALPKYRGFFNNGFQLSICIGALTSNLINYGIQRIRGGWGWRISLAVAGVPALAITLVAIFLPETPNSLIQRVGKCDKARHLLQRLRGTNDVQAELNDLIRASEVSKAIDNPYKNIIRRAYRPQFVMSVAIPFFQQVTGINVIAFYAPILFRIIGFSESASLLSNVMTGGIGIVMAFVSMLIVDRLGRRALLIFGGITMIVPQLLIGTIMASKLGDHGSLSKGYANAILVLLGIYVAGFGVSWGPLGWLIPSEIFPLEIRSAGQSITVGVNFLFTFLIGQTFLAMLCHFKAGTFFFFGGWVVVMTLFVYFFLPETKNAPIEQVERIWREHWFWKSFVGLEEECEEINKVIEG